MKSGEDPQYIKLFVGVCVRTDTKHYKFVTLSARGLAHACNRRGRCVSRRAARGASKARKAPAAAFSADTSR